MSKQLREDQIRRQQLRSLSQDLQSRYQPILVSNRGPVELWVDDFGKISGRRGAGGVVTALAMLTNYLDVTWVAAAMSDGERELMDKFGHEIKWRQQGSDFTLRLVETSRSVYRRYYNVFANPLLWFLQHYMLNTTSTSSITRQTHSAWTQGYVPMNRAFAEAVVDTARGDTRRPLVLLQDYHLYFASKWIREQRPDALISHFVHIPWPAPRYWLSLPSEMRLAIWESLAAADVVGFQTAHDRHNFLQGCEEFLPDAKVDHSAGTVATSGHRVRARTYPISVDVAALHQLARSRRVRNHAARLRPKGDELTVVRVDRVEPTKNIALGFEAYGLMLREHRELRERVRFLAFLVPSRTSLAEYKQCYDEVMSTVQAVNDRFGTPNWTPIEVFYENNYAQAIAGMTLYDVLLVNALTDGMNLVAKEGPTVNTQDGVLVISEGIGAQDELKDHATSVAALDIVGTARAMYEGLTMAPLERTQRERGLKRTIAENDLTRWLETQLRDLSRLDEPRLRLLPAS